LVVSALYEPTSSYSVVSFCRIVHRVVSPFPQSTVLFAFLCMFVLFIAAHVKHLVFRGIFVVIRFRTSPVLGPTASILRTRHGSRLSCVSNTLKEWIAEASRHLDGRCFFRRLSSLLINGLLGISILARFALCSAGASGSPWNPSSSSSSLSYGP
jgi:hypothetical protein